MSIDETREKARAVYEMVQTPGWRLIEQFINRRREAVLDQMRLEDFTDLLKVGRLQGEIQAYHTLHSHIQKILRAAESLLKEG